MSWHHVSPKEIGVFLLFPVSSAGSPVQPGSTLSANCNRDWPNVVLAHTLGPLLGITHLKLEATKHFPDECPVVSCFAVCSSLILFSSMQLHKSKYLLGIQHHEDA